MATNAAPDKPRGSGLPLRLDMRRLPNIKRYTVTKLGDQGPGLAVAELQQFRHVNSGLLGHFLVTPDKAQAHENEKRRRQAASVADNLVRALNAARAFAAAGRPFSPFGAAADFRRSVKATSKYVSFRRPNSVLLMRQLEVEPAEFVRVIGELAEYLPIPMRFDALSPGRAYAVSREQIFETFSAPSWKAALKKRNEAAARPVTVEYLMALQSIAVGNRPNAGGSAKSFTFAQWVNHEKRAFKQIRLRRQRAARSQRKS